MTVSFDPVDLSSLQNLRSFDCSGSQLGSWPQLPTSLEKINCTDCWLGGNDPTIGDTNAMARLTVARLANCTASRAILGSIEISNSCTLTRLEVDLHHYQDVFFRLLGGGQLKHLTFLGLSFQGLEDGHVELFVEHCEDLETLELTSARVTGVFIASLLAAPKCRLKRLALKDCEKVSPDAIDWAKNRGVQIVRTSAESWGSGRRVRDAH